MIERLVLSLTKKGDCIFDPFLGTGTSIIAAVKHGRRGAGAEIMAKYAAISRDRIAKAFEGTLPTRPMMKPVFDPRDAGKNLLTAPWLKNGEPETPMMLAERPVKYKVRLRK